MTAHFIFYVGDQVRSTAFYAAALGYAPRLNVPGMTEFALPGGAVLGLMPESGIVALLGPSLPDPRHGSGIPRAELYLLAADPGAAIKRAIGAGAIPLSPLQPRDWGHVAGYVLDLDGHVLAFATVVQSTPAISGHLAQA